MLSIKNLSSKKIRIIASIFLLSGIFTWFYFNAPLKDVFEYNVDEGIDSIKSLLHLNGFRLYKEIWSDQPPLFTVILSFWYKIFGASFYFGRILVLSFSAFLILTFYLTIKNLWGRISAFAGCLFLIMSLSYLRLSASIMMGLPALALAMASIYYAVICAKSKLKYPLILSGILLALSLQTKFFTAPLIPIIALAIGRARKLWLAVVLFTYLAITVIFFYPDFCLLIPQLVKPHFTLLNSYNQHLPVIYNMLLQDYDVALLALTGIILSIKKRDQRLLLPFSWLLLNSAMLLAYKPVWYHYYPLISLPVCWLAAISIGNFFALKISQGWFPKKNTFDMLDVLFRWLTIGLIILSITLLPAKYYRMRNSLQGKTSFQEHQILQLLLKYKPNTHWIFSDLPTFAFSAGILIPPEIAVTTVKREFTSERSGDYFIGILQKYKPEQILLSSSYRYSPKIISFIRENYLKIYDDYLLKSPDYPYPNRDLEISWRKEPIGSLLPKKMRFTLNKRFYDLIWNSIFIPLPQKKEIAVTIHKTRVEIFVRK